MLVRPLPERNADSSRRSNDSGICLPGLKAGAAEKNEKASGVNPPYRVRATLPARSYSKSWGKSLRATFGDDSSSYHLNGGVTALRKSERDCPAP